MTITILLSYEFKGVSGTSQGNCVMVVPELLVGGLVVLMRLQPKGQVHITVYIESFHSFIFMNIHIILQIK